MPPTFPLAYADRMRKSTIQFRVAAPAPDIDPFTPVVEDGDSSFALSDDGDDGGIDIVLTEAFNAVQEAAQEEVAPVTEETPVAAITITTTAVSDPIPSSHTCEAEDVDANPITKADTTGPLVAPPQERLSGEGPRKRKPSQTDKLAKVPLAPSANVVKRTRSERLLSSTSRELELIAAEREAMRRQKEAYDRVYHNVKTNAVAPAPRVPKPPTQVRVCGGECECCVYCARTCVYCVSV